MAPDDGTLRCKHCGYRLDRLPEHRCPECGGGFNPADTSLLVLSNRHPRVIVSVVVLAPVFFLLGLLIAMVVMFLAGLPVSLLWPGAIGLLAAVASIPVIVHAATHRK